MDWSAYYKRSTDTGVTWPPTDTVIATGFGAAYNPDLALSGDNVYYAWQANLRLNLARSTNGGTSWSPATPVYTHTGTAYPDLSLAAGPTGTLHLFWDESVSGGQDACYIRSSNGGLTWSTPTCPVNLLFSYTPTDPDLAIDPADGSLHLVYLADVGRTPTVMHMSSSNGGLSWGSAITVSDPTYRASEPSITISGSQKIYVSWTESHDGTNPADTDIYYARSQNDGLAWGTPSRVNDDSAQPQLHSYLAAGKDGPRAIWSDYRSNTQWDIYSAAISGTCTTPLTGITMGGPAAPDPGITTTYTAIITPATGADLPISYDWTPDPGLGQGTASAQYNWPVPGSYPITVTASNCGGPVWASRTVVVQCSAGLIGVSIDGAVGPSPIVAGDIVTLTAVPDPLAPNPVVTYTWAPPPLTGQGTITATYRWQVVGSHPVTVTAANCGGTVTGTASVVVTDTVLPTWGALRPAGWITTTQSPTVTVVVSDAQSGLDVSTGQYEYYNGSWSGWLTRTVSGADFTTTSQTITTPAVPFGKDSTLADGQARIRFQVRDMAGNLGASPEYTLTIDTQPPVMTPVTITSNRLKSTWINPQTDPLTWTATMSWTAATDAFSGVGGYSYLWSVDETALPPAVISTTALNAATIIPAYGQHWYFHVRAVDSVGNWSATAVHQGPYWVGNAPTAFLTLDPESSGPGAEVILTGFGFDPQATVRIGFTSTAGIHWLGGDVQTSYDGVFQAAATVPDTATVSTAHGFIVQTQPSGKQGSAKFNVTQGMQILILNPNDQVNPGGYAWIKANYANKFGSLVLEMDGAGYAGPFPMNGVTTRQASLQVPMNAISGTRTLTVTNSVGGYIVQRNTAEFHIVVPTPPTPLSATLPTIDLNPEFGIRGTTVMVTGRAPSACRLLDATHLDCDNIALFLDLQETTEPVSTTLKYGTPGSDMRVNLVDINPYTGDFTGTLQLKDNFTQTASNQPWGQYNLCLFSDHQYTYTGANPPEFFPQAAALASRPQGVVPRRPNHLGDPLAADGGLRPLQSGHAWELRGAHPPGRHLGQLHQRIPVPADRRSGQQYRILHRHPPGEGPPDNYPEQCAGHHHQRGRGQLLDRRLRLRLRADDESFAPELRPFRLLPKAGYQPEAQRRTGSVAAECEHGLLHRPGQHG
jgi:hypothetical protein